HPPAVVEGDGDGLADHRLTGDQAHLQVVGDLHALDGFLGGEALGRGHGAAEENDANAEQGSVHGRYFLSQSRACKQTPRAFPVSSWQVKALKALKALIVTPSRAGEACPCLSLPCAIRFLKALKALKALIISQAPGLKRQDGAHDE